MSLPFRALFVTALLFGFLAPVPSSAKGGFDFIAVSGPGVKEEIRITDEALTRDFFAFSNFYENRTDAPAEPGPGYEITRYYLQGAGSVPFDKLHYYPETGSVYYDGIAGGGSSEYDGGWYTAEPGIRAPFENALANRLQSSGLSTGAVEASSAPAQALALIAALASVAAVLMALSWLRTPSTR